jgi:capsular polysaccharide transport system permease protein
MASGQPGSVIAHESAISVQLRVIYALVLRDTRTRFGRSFGGYVLIVLWPFTHAMFLMSGYYIVHKVAPIGTEVSVFVGTGVLPYIICVHPARTMMLCIVQNQFLMNFPIVKAADVIIARGVLEIINAFWVVFLLCAVMYIAGIDFLPQRPEEAILAILASIYLGFSMGFTAAIFYKLVRFWLGIQIGILILMYIGSGAFILPSMLPAIVRDIIWFNPMFHAVEWLRSAYYEGYGQGMLSKEYLLAYATVTLFFGLLAERGVRGKLMEAH